MTYFVVWCIWRRKYARILWETTLDCRLSWGSLYIKSYLQEAIKSRQQILSSPCSYWNQDLVQATNRSFTFNRKEIYVFIITSLQSYYHSYVIISPCHRIRCWHSHKLNLILYMHSVYRQDMRHALLRRSIF
jgi:hypothetical protein